MTKQLTKTKRFTFSNDFHNTTCTVVAKLCANQRGYKISYKQFKNVKKSLCGVSDCSCGGIRGKQDGFNWECHNDFVYIYGFNSEVLEMQYDQEMYGY